MEKVEIFKDLFASKNKDGSRTFTKRDIERPEVINLIRYWTLNGVRQQTIYDGLGSTNINMVQMERYIGQISFCPCNDS